MGNSKAKGNIGEVLTLAEMVKRGIPVAIPYGDNQRYDLIAEFNGKLNRIQIKYCSQVSENDAIICPCASSTNHTTNKHYTTYVGDVDYFVFYLVPWDQLILVPIEDVGDKKSVTFRKTETKSGSKVTSHFVQDYTFDKQIKS